MPVRPVYLISAVAAVVALTQCAKQANPIGGPKDITPPVMVSSDPAPGSTSFSRKLITVTFDEYFTLDKLSEKFLISPPLKEKPKVTVKNKTLLIEFKGGLKDSTTYTLNFPDVIKDLNEGNLIPNFQYVFSTGKFLDSLSVTGNVVRADNLEAEKNVMVLMYSSIADSAPRKILPDYITVADENGYFRINNVKGGKYKLYALIDANSDNRYDMAEESFAFSDSLFDVNPLNGIKPLPSQPKDTVQVKKPVKKSGSARDEKAVKKDKVIPFYKGDHKLYLFTSEKKERYLESSSRKVAYKMMFALSRPPDTMQFKFRLVTDPASPYLREESRNKDTVTIWLRDSTVYRRDTIRTIIDYPFTDSTGRVRYREDTLVMRYTAQKTRGKQAVKKLQVTENFQGGNIKPGQRVFFTSSTPLIEPDTSRLRLYHLNGKERERVKAGLKADSAGTRKYYLVARLEEGEKYLLIRDKGMFRDIYGLVSDSAGIIVNVKNRDAYGHLVMSVSNGKGNLIIQLLTQKEGVIEERKITDKGQADFPLLERGFYRLRVIYDLNGDGKWTPGNYDLKLQPEPVSYYREEVEVRANFDITDYWDVGLVNVKEQVLKEKKETVK
ncbi:MAG TPA: Ig-like domain-containing domain [Bacteroidales bacterium]|nr:Ig-like domain-containing domain [Bacteroidales bacterium]